MGTFQASTSSLLGSERARVGLSPILFSPQEHPSSLLGERRLLQLLDNFHFYGDRRSSCGMMERVLFILDLPITGNLVLSR